MSGKNVEEAGEDFSFVAGPAISLDRFGMGEEGRLDQSRGKESRGEIKATQRKKQSYRGGLSWLCTSQKADPFSFLGDGGAWTQSVEFVLLLAQSWHALAEKVDEGHTKVLNASSVFVCETAAQTLLPGTLRSDDYGP